MRVSIGGTGGPDPRPLKNHNNIGFLTNTGPDPLRITKLSSQHSILAIIGRPAKRHHGVLLAGQWWPVYILVKSSNRSRVFLSIFGKAIRTTQISFAFPYRPVY